MDNLLRFVMIFAALQQKYPPKRIPFFLIPRPEDRGYEYQTPAGFYLQHNRNPGDH